MPSIKYKKKTYAGATFPVLEMTKAEYDALPEAKKMDGTVYMITDDTGGWEAENASYDNTESGLTATNVQDALDEINSKKIILDYKDINYTKKITVPANSIINFTDSDIGRVTPTDYIFGMILQISTGSADVVVRNFGINGYSLRNLLGQAVSAEFFLSIRYIRIKETVV